MAKAKKYEEIVMKVSRKPNERSESEMAWQPG
jgi:hypothetical protein